MAGRKPTAPGLAAQVSAHVKRHVGRTIEEILATGEVLTSLGNQASEFGAIPSDATAEQLRDAAVALSSAALQAGLHAAQLAGYAERLAAYGRLREAMAS
jgi:hypothetical protein